MGLAADAVAGAKLHLSDITVRQGRALVLDGLALSPSPRRVTTILGGSARARTALFDVVAGFERAPGAILLDGRDITRCSSQGRGFGILRRNDRLFPHLTLAQNVAFPLSIRGVGGAQRLALAAGMMDVVQLGKKVWDLLPSRTGQEERQLALLARAAVCAPRLLLLDDPFSTQEAAAKWALVGALRNIHALSGATTLLFGADAAAALAVTDDVAVMRGGAIIQHGSAQEVFDHPHDPGVAALLGETNILPGHVEAIEDDVTRIRLACGPVVEARPDMALRPGDQCLLTLRPGRIAVATMPAAEMGEAAIDARVVEVRFMGEVHRLRLLIGFGAELVVWRSVGAGLRGLSIGSAISVAWQPHHAWASPIQPLDGRRPMTDS